MSFILTNMNFTIHQTKLYNYLDAISEMKIEGLSIFIAWVMELIVIQQNKMNKTNSSKLTYKTQHPMRVLLKNRNGHTDVHKTIDIPSIDTNSANKSEVIIAQDEVEKSIQKRYESKKRMKTQYSDHFSQLAQNQKSFNRIKSFKGRHTLENQTVDVSLNNTKGQTKSINKHKLIQLQDSFIEKKPNTEQKKQQKPIQKRDQITSFQQIESKIENLMNKRLNDCLQFKKNSDWVIDTELGKLIQSYKQVKSSKNPQLKQEDIESLQRNINMLQRLIAQNIIESEIAKKYYLSKVANHHYRHNKTQTFTNEPVRQLKNQGMRLNSIINTSNNQDDYKSPSKNAYDIQKGGSYFFNVDRHRQPLPRSSYKRDFLIYGAVKNEQPYRPNQNESLKGVSSAKIVNSSYQSSFVPKKADKINIKELDAYRDKFKNLPIIFGKKEKDMLAYNLSYFNVPKEENQPKPQVVDRSRFKSNPHHFQTEARREFVMAVKICPTEIKHKNIQKLKYNYKRDLHV